MSKILHKFGFHKWLKTRRGLVHSGFGNVSQKYYCKHCGMRKIKVLS